MNLIFSKKNVCLRAEPTRSAAKSLLQAVTAEHPQTEIPAPERLPGACTSQGHVSPDPEWRGQALGVSQCRGLESYSAWHRCPSCGVTAE